MPKALAVPIGSRFGKLTVLGAGERTAQGKIRWRCACDCGNESSPVGSRVKLGYARSCGCAAVAAGEAHCDRSRAQIEGQRFDRLVAVKRIGASCDRKAIWLCVCDCGGQRAATAKTLRAGLTTSCGCKKRELARAWTQGRRKYTTDAERVAAERELLQARRTRPAAVARRRIASLFSYALRLVGEPKRSPTFQALGYTKHDLVRHLERQFLPGMTWENRGAWHIDHIVPISVATSEEEVIALNALSNLRPLWAKQNMSKGARRETLI